MGVQINSQLGSLDVKVLLKQAWIIFFYNIVYDLLPMENIVT